MNSPKDKHRIVIVGGGAGGLELATRLGDKLGKRGRAEVILIDKNRTHVWKPKLHEIASGSMDMSAHEVDYLAQAHWHGFRFRLGELTGIDRERREVRVAAHLDDEGELVTPARAFGYDTLVLAIGSLLYGLGTILTGFSKDPLSLYLTAGVLTEGKGTPRFSREILQKFSEKSGATICKELKGAETGKVLCECPECVRNAVLALGETLGDL